MCDVVIIAEADSTTSPYSSPRRSASPSAWSIDTVLLNSEDGDRDMEPDSTTRSRTTTPELNDVSSSSSDDDDDDDDEYAHISLAEWVRMARRELDFERRMEELFEAGAEDMDVDMNMEHI